MMKHVRLAADVPLANPMPNRRRDSALVGVSNLASGLAGAGVALVLGLVSDSQAETDGVLAAHSLYAVVVLLAAIARSTLVPLLGTADDDAAYRGRAHSIGAQAVLLGLVAGLAVVITAPLAAPLLTAQLPDESAQAATVTLLLLGPAIACQAYGAVGSAILGGAHRFARSAGIYAAGALATLLSAYPLIALTGALGAPLAVLAGTAVIASAHAYRLRAFGLRIRPGVHQSRAPGQWVLGRHLLSVSALQLAVQAGLALAIANASGDPGDVTRYAYAFFGMLMVVSVTSGASALVALPQLVARLESGDPAAVRVYLRTAGLPALAIVVPMLIGIAAFGRPILGGVFASTFSGEQVDQLYHLCLVLALLAPIYVLLQLVQGVAIAERRAGDLVRSALLGTGLTAAAMFAVRGDTEAVATAHVLSAAGFAVITARIVLGRRAWALLGRLLCSAWPALALSVPMALAGFAVGADGAVLGAGGGLAMCLVAYGLLGARLWPEVLGSFPGLSRVSARSAERAG